MAQTFDPDLMEQDVYKRQTLTGKLGNAFIEGLQGDGEYLKIAACAKHFAVHSGPEALRHEFNAVVSEKDLWETYLPAFETAVKDCLLYTSRRHLGH